MYYVCGNIIKPLTEPFQISCAELIGSTAMEWFVSHYWGMAARHLGEAVRKHAQSADSLEWRDTAYWICTFSNSQWDVRTELGNGQWQERGMSKALGVQRDGATKRLSVVSRTRRTNTHWELQGPGACGCYLVVLHIHLMALIFLPFVLAAAASSFPPHLLLPYLLLR